jgi:triosephosphate isomerase
VAIGQEKLLPEQVQEMHEFIRETVRKALEAISEAVCYLWWYVKPDNAKKFSKPDVDGGLIGGAALKVVLLQSLMHFKLNDSFRKSDNSFYRFFLYNSIKEKTFAKK